MIEQALFLAAALLAVVGAAMAACVRNLFHAALALPAPHRLSPGGPLHARVDEGGELARRIDLGRGEARVG